MNEKYNNDALIKCSVNIYSHYRYKVLVLPL